MNKTCSRCKQSYPLTNEHFGPRKISCDGFTGICKGCQRRDRNARNDNRRDEINAALRLRRAKLPKKVKVRVIGPCRNGHEPNRNKRGQCIECQRERLRRFHHRNRDARNQQSREYLVGWRAKNLDKMKRDNAAWRAANKERHAKKSAEWRRKNWDRVYSERLSDPQKRLRSTLSSSVCIQLRKGGTKKETTATRLIGCSIPEFMAHIERQWTRGMSWKNWGRKGRCWQLDHRKPVSSFDLTDPAQRAACFHYTNYQPLWMRENLSKNDKDPIVYAQSIGRLL